MIMNSLSNFDSFIDMGSSLVCSQNNTNRNINFFHDIEYNHKYENLIHSFQNEQRLSARESNIVRNFDSYTCYRMELFQHQEKIFYLERFEKKIYTSVYVVFWMETLFERYEFDKVNEVLAEIDIKFLEEWSIVSLLRSTYFAKEFLPAWHSFYIKSRQHLEFLGKEDIDGILIGLDG